jgi:hypothetical protein
MHDAFGDDGTEGEAKKVLASWMEAAGPGECGNACVDELFRMFRLRACYSPDGAPEQERKAKLQHSLNMSPDLRTVIHLATGPPAQVPTVDMRSFQSAFALGLIKAGGTKPTGAGPRTELERTVERQLRNFQRV